MDFIMFNAVHNTDKPIRIVIAKNGSPLKNQRVYTVGGNTPDGFSYTYHTYTLLGDKVRYEVNIRSMIGDRKVDHYCQYECAVSDLHSVEDEKGPMPKWRKIGEREEPLQPLRVSGL